MEPTLLSVFEQLKEQRAALSSLMAEVCAVRDSLCEIGPKYREILERHRAKHIQGNRELVFSVLQQYDEIIHRLKAF